jgi:hypothetical protein
MQGDAMSDNTHPAVAKFRQKGVHGWQSEQGATDATCLAAILDAQVEATLALAYEQRTMNLIAYQANVERSYHQTLTRARSGQANELNRQIIERLGLEDDRGTR